MISTRARWTREHCLNLRTMFLKASCCPSPFGLTDEGLCDFRGVRVDDSLHGLAIENCDFSDAEVGDGQLMAKFRNCKFVELKCDGSLGENFTDCMFHKASLGNSVLYGQFMNCDFSYSSLAGARGSGLMFKSCTFENTNLRKASFYDSKFIGSKLVNCTIALGSLAGSIFEDCEIRNFDYSNAVLTRVKGLETVGVP